MEIWKEVVGYEGLYEVSNLGRVKSLNYNKTKKEKLLKSTVSNGYLNNVLCKNKNRKAVTVHKLVAMAFLNHTPCGSVLVVNHINFNKLDNRVENLEIVTTRENSNRKHIKSSSQYTGVYKRGKKWRACIVVKGKKNNLGTFNTELEAHHAYQNKLLSLNTINN